MRDIVKTIENMVINGQFQALLVTIGCVTAVVKAAETVFKIIAGIAAALALIYFFDPSFYSSISNIIVGIFHRIVGISTLVTGG